MRYQINEFLRVLGLTPVVIGRGEYVTGVMGNGLLRGLLNDLFMQEVSNSDPGGILHMSKILPEQQVRVLADLPYPSAKREEVFAANLAVARVFIPRAKVLAASLGVAWPEAFEDATRRVLEEKLNVVADW